MFFFYDFLIRIRKSKIKRIRIRKESVGEIYFKDENGNEVKPRVRLVKSSMTRATETGDIIHKHLADIPIESCDLIREGAPCMPEPPIGKQYAL